MGKWGNIEIEGLKTLYQEYDIPSDPLVKDKIVLEKFTTDFNKRNSTNFSSKEIADELFKLRKGKKLPPIRRCRT